MKIPHISTPQISLQLMFGFDVSVSVSEKYFEHLSRLLNILDIKRPWVPHQEVFSDGQVLLLDGELHDI